MLPGGALDLGKVTKTWLTAQKPVLWKITFNAYILCNYVWVLAGFLSPKLIATAQLICAFHPPIASHGHDGSDGHFASSPSLSSSSSSSYLSSITIITINHHHHNQSPSTINHHQSSVISHQSSSSSSPSIRVEPGSHSPWLQTLHDLGCLQPLTCCNTCMQHATQPHKSPP